MDRNLLELLPWGGLGAVALRKESVDRNFVSGSNRAIDIVALRKESVDRNLSFPVGVGCLISRSPQGERG